MTDKSKNVARSRRGVIVYAVKMTLTGALLIVIAGLIIALAASVARRYPAPEDALANYPQPRRYETSWRETEEKPRKIIDFKLTQRLTLADMNAVQLIFTWREDIVLECAGSLTMREIRDIFGGWEELRYSGGGCSSGSGGGGSAGLDFWESPAGESPRYYYFAYIGTTSDEGAIEFALSDGTSASASPVEDSIGLIVRRSEPFYIDKIRYLDANGELIFEQPGI